MSKYCDQNTELQLMEVSQDCTSISHQSNTFENRHFSTQIQSDDDWRDPMDDISDHFDEYVDVDSLVDTELDSDIIDFNIDVF